MTRGGLPHSDISGSKLICSSPELFAACHVLHRLLAPRHSPYTLSSLTIRNSRTNAVGPLAASRRTYCDSSHATLRVGSQVRLPHLETLCCGRKKLPFAEYSVVKDQPGGFAPNPRPGRSVGPQGPTPLPLLEILLATQKSRRTLITSAPQSVRRLRVSHLRCRERALG
jgi:hypothetical protein